tara:strand:- start:252 stop:539 length:288 start_codon:yes stop_codon:yes gene_type:complete
MINFTKMHGLGNDFVVINNLDGDVCFSTEEIRQLSDRRLGIGFDQLLMVESATSRMLILNISYLIQMVLKLVSVEMVQGVLHYIFKKRTYHIKTP